MVIALAYLRWLETPRGLTASVLEEILLEDSSHLLIGVQRWLGSMAFLVASSLGIGVLFGPPIFWNRPIPALILLLVSSILVVNCWTNCLALLLLFAATQFVRGAGFGRR